MKSKAFNRAETGIDLMAIDLMVNYGKDLIATQTATFILNNVNFSYLYCLQILSHSSFFT